MAFEDTMQETEGISALSAMPQEEEGMQGAPPGGGVPGMPGIPGLGGPGVDTPQEQKAVQALMEGAKAFRLAAQSDPSIKPLVDALLQDGFIKITQHYGVGEEGKMALKQAQMAEGRARSAALSYGGGPTQGPPIGSGSPGAAPSMPTPPNSNLTY
jgi:hypothetical protein